MLKSLKFLLLAFSNFGSVSSMTTVLEDKRRAALLGLYIADATAMPVHWMYNRHQLRSDYGTITGFVKPKDKFEGSIMNLSNTGGGGRGSDKGEIVGSVILHGKKKYWLRGGNYHYHLGLEAGENTLEAQICRLLTRNIAEIGDFSSESFLQKYIDFMTTPGNHNDTYASTCHRMFFANFVNGKEPSKCADNDGHNTDAIDALTLTVPIILKYSEADRTVRNEKINEIIACTRKSRVLGQYGEVFGDILVSILHGKSIRESIDQYSSKSIKMAVERGSGSPDEDPMVACYIDSAFPALLFFAYKYADSPEKAILASANAGGENVARGSLLGAMMGAAHGVDALPTWGVNNLHNGDTIKSEIDEFVKKCS